MAIFRTLDLQPAGASVSAVGGARVAYIDAHNNNAAARFIKIFDKASAPTLPGDTPVWTIEIGPGQHLSIPLAGKDGQGMLMCKNGIAIAGTQLVADADATAPTANDLVVNLIFTP